MLRTAIWRTFISPTVPQRICRGVATAASPKDSSARKALTTSTAKRRRTPKAIVQQDADNETDGADERTDSLTSGKIVRPGSLVSTSNRQDVQRQRPPLSTFNKRGGFPRDLLRNLADFPHALLLTRVGQFYEAYFDQAIEISDLLKIRLTTKSMENTRYPMCGFPIAQMDKFMEKLVREHNRFVAVCEEFRTYDNQGGLLGITRKVVRVVTPGTLVDEGFIEKHEHNFLLAVDTSTSNTSGVELAWIDTSTGELYTQASCLDGRTLAEDLARINPAEVVLRPELDGEQNQRHVVRKCLDNLDRLPRIAYPKNEIPEIQAGEPSSAIPLLSAYIGETLLDQRPNLSHPLRVRPANTMRIDRVSLRALEMRQNNDGGRSGTLLSVIDRTVTSAGMRMLSDRIGSPSKSLTEINNRLAVVAIFSANALFREEVIQRLRQLDDEARLLQKMSIGRPTADDLVVMARAIRVHEDIRQVLLSGLRESRQASPDDPDLLALAQLAEQLTDHTTLSAHIESAVDVEALEARRLQDPATDPTTTIAQPASVDESEEDEGIDIWDVATGMTKKAQKTVSEDTARTISPRKVVAQSITWGKQESTVMQPNSSSTVARLYDNILRVENKAKRFYRDLSKDLNCKMVHAEYPF